MNLLSIDFETRSTNIWSQINLFLKIAYTCTIYSNVSFFLTIYRIKIWWNSRNLVDNPTFGNLIHALKKIEASQHQPGFSITTTTTIDLHRNGPLEELTFDPMGKIKHLLRFNLFIFGKEKKKKRVKNIKYYISDKFVSLASLCCPHWCYIRLCSICCPVSFMPDLTWIFGFGELWLNFFHFSEWEKERQK